MSKRIGKCPQCGETVRLARDNPWRPFCSERCRLIDLGEWLEGGRSIPTDKAGVYHGSDDDGEPTQH